MRILYVDDDEDDISFFKEVLEELDETISFVSFNNGLDALNYLRNSSHLPDYMILDMNMPGVKGKEILSRMKKDELLQSVKVIIYSTTNWDADTFIKKGAFRYIKKPCSIKGMIDTISSILHAG